MGGAAERVTAEELANALGGTTTAPGIAATKPKRSPRRTPADGSVSLVPIPTVEAEPTTVIDVPLPLGDPPATLAQQKTSAEIRKLHLEAERISLEVESLRRKDRDAVAEPGRSRLYTFYSGVSSDSVQACMAELGTWSRRDPGAPITVLFNSPGGPVLDGLALYDFLRQLRAMGHHLTTVALGRAASMGAVVLQAGDRRLIGENAFMLIHEVSNLSSGKVSEMEDGVEFSRRLQHRLVAILASRSRLTAQQIQRRWARKEWWLDAPEAVALGLADAVL